MKDFLAPFAVSLPFIAAVTQEELTFWERIAEKWGIGFIGLGLFAALAYWTAKRENALQATRDKRDADAQAERLALLTRNNELQEQAIEAQRKHANELKQIIRDGNKYQEDVGRELKNLARRVRCPGTTPPQTE